MPWPNEVIGGGRKDWYKPRTARKVLAWVAVALPVGLILYVVVEGRG